jgi:endonuclease/exonuclease/phosphatase family metal-dependent hydrolase
MTLEFRKPFQPGIAFALLVLLNACTATSIAPLLPPSELRESSNLAEVAQTARELAALAGQDRVLVIYDLDNTLLAMEQDLGSDLWYYWQKELETADRCDPRVVGDRLAAQGALYFASAMRPTQPEAASVVSELQDEGFTSIILTSRGADFAPSSLRELRRNGLDFSRRPLGDGATLRFKPAPDSRETLYESGVYLTAGQDKGEMLLALFRATNTALPRAIVMADDKAENLQAVLDALADQPVSVQALRYDREDTRVAEFDAAQAAAQWQMVEPALLQLQEVFGTDNYQLPEPVRPEGCGDAQSVPDSTAMNAQTVSSASTQVRVATFNIAMGFSDAGEMAAALQDPLHQRLQQVAAILQTVRPDIVLLNEFDYDPAIDAASLLNRNFLAVPATGRQAIEYPYHFRAESNTGIRSGLDIDSNGKTDGPEDAWGFGYFPGQYGMLLLSRFPIDTAAVRTFQRFLWADLDGAKRPMNPDGSHFYTDETWQQLRLSSKSHWDVPVKVGDQTLHVLAFHPTPPVFDGPENRNGRRNYDEIRLWADYLRPEVAAAWSDDQGRKGGLATEVGFVILGDINADPQTGDSHPGAVQQLLEHERVDSSVVPRSRGAAEASRQQAGVNAQQKGDPAADTADFDDRYTGNLRIDYTLPSRNLRVLDAGVFWPASDEPGHELSRVSDHHLVWIDVVPGGGQP